MSFLQRTSIACTDQLSYNKFPSFEAVFILLHNWMNRGVDEWMKDEEWINDLIGCAKYHVGIVLAGLLPLSVTIR